MKITFLGTGAADWPLEKPSDYTEFRRLSSALIDNSLLIDPGPQVLDALKELGISLSKIKYVIITHRHKDHFNADTLKALEDCGASLIEFFTGEEKTVGDYEILAFNGNHATSEGTLHYIIKKDGKVLFYGLDGAWLLYDEVAAIKKHKPDLAVLDATIGDIDGDYRIFEHNNLSMVLQMQQSLKQYVKRFCISHMARTLHTDHNTLSEKMKKYDVITAYDGLSIEI